jgi:rhodanese-related sulfurtransferase
MRISIICTFIVFFIFLEQGNAQAIHPEVPRIDSAMAFYKYKAGSIILIDAMDRKTFDRKHILGSINIPNDGPQDLERVRNMELPFPKDKNILVYCM